MSSPALAGAGWHLDLMGAVPAFGINLGDFSPMAWLGDAAAVDSAFSWPIDAQRSGASASSSAQRSADRR